MVDGIRLVVSDDFVHRIRIPDITKDHLIPFLRFLGAWKIKLDDRNPTRPQPISNQPPKIPITTRQ